MGLKGGFLFLVAFASFPFGGSLAVASGPFLLAFSLRLEEEKGNFPTWVDRCVSHCWQGHSSLLGRREKQNCPWFTNVAFTGRASLVAQTVVRETWLRSLGQEDPLEKEMATHSSTLA